MAWEEVFEIGEAPVGEPPVPPAWLVAAWEEQDRREGATAPAARAAAGFGRADRLVEALRDLDSLEARQAAERARLLAALTEAVGGGSTDPMHRADAPSIAASEVAAALKVSQRSAAGQIAEALQLTSPEWAPVLQAMEAGRLPRRRSAAILDAALPVPHAKRHAFAAAAVAYACPEDADRAPSPGALGRRLRRLVEEYATDPLQTRKREATTRRRVGLEPAPDGMCWLTAYPPLEVGAAIDTRLEALARSLQTPGEPRGLGQLRLDVFADLLSTGAAAAGETTGGYAGRPGLAVGSAPAGTRTEIIVTVPARTLQGSADEPGDILGYGPIDADAVRLMAAEAATWSRMWVDPEDGAPVALGRRRYTPTLAMRRQLGARDAVCRFPGCDTPAAATEADHTVEWADGGTTDLRNLALLCREHHRLKSLGQWKLRQLGQEGPSGAARSASGGGLSGPTARPAKRAPFPPGTLGWISPTGHRHVSYPEPEPPPPF